MPEPSEAISPLTRNYRYGFVATLEGIYTRTLQDILYHDLNLAPSGPNLILGNTHAHFTVKK